MSGMQVSFNGLDGLLKQLDRLGKDSGKEAGKALYAEAKVEEKEMRARTPVLTGALRASFITKVPEQVGANVTQVAIECGGPAAKYALAVHENLDAEHKNGEAKFMEQPLNESAPYMAERLGRRLQQVLLK